MKKILVVGVALVLLVAMGSVAMAEEFDEGLLGIEASVLPYGEISGWPEGLDLGELDGTSGYRKTALTSVFNIIRNSSLLLQLTIDQPLTTTVEFSGQYNPLGIPSGGGTYDFELGTIARLQWRRSLSGWWDMIVVVDGPNVEGVTYAEGKPNFGRAADHVTGTHLASNYETYLRLSKDWRIEVTAVLGDDIDDQPAGDYTGQLTLTVSAPLS